MFKVNQIHSSSLVKDLIGKRFGRLVVLERTKDHVTPKGKHMVKWLCQCDCGRKVKVLSTALKNGNTTSCGCYSHEVHTTKRDTPNKNAENYIGKVFGLLTVVQEIKPYRNGEFKYRRFRCQCYCGKFKDVRANQLTTGVSISCGCISKRKFEMLKAFLKEHE